MDAIEYLKVRSRMTNNCNISCGNCPLYYENNGKKKTCTEFESLYPNEAIKIVEEWGDKYPRMTNKDKYIEVMKNTFGDNFDLDICSQRMPQCRCSDVKCSECKKFWHSEYKEKEQEEK